MIWIEWKRDLSSLTGLSEDALHIYAALFTLVGGALLLKRSLAHPLPLFLVLIAVVVNEAGDLYLPGNPIEPWQIEGAIKDLWNTMLAPSLLFLLARFRPSLFDQSLPDSTRPR